MLNVRSFIDVSLVFVSCDLIYSDDDDDCQVLELWLLFDNYWEFVLFVVLKFWDFLWVLWEIRFCG